MSTQQVGIKLLRCKQSTRSQKFRIQNQLYIVCLKTLKVNHGLEFYGGQLDTKEGPRHRWSFFWTRPWLSTNQSWKEEMKEQHPQGFFTFCRHNETVINDLICHSNKAMQQKECPSWKYPVMTWHLNIKQWIRLVLLLIQTWNKCQSF